MRKLMTTCKLTSIWPRVQFWRMPKFLRGWGEGRTRIPTFSSTGDALNRDKERRSGGDFCTVAFLSRHLHLPTPFAFAMEKWTHQVKCRQAWQVSSCRMSFLPRNLNVFPAISSSGKKPVGTFLGCLDRCSASNCRGSFRLEVINDERVPENTRLIVWRFQPILSRVRARPLKSVDLNLS